MAHALVFLLLAVSSVYGKSVSLWTEIGISPTKLKPFIMDIGPFAASGGACDNGTRQSPIDIQPCTRASMNALRLKGHSLTRTDAFTMINTGHTAQISYGGTAPTLYGGPLAEEYTLLQMHFHWGADDEEGSEHAVNGHFGALEAHFVHYKTAYGNVDEAINHEDGLAVVGVIFELTDDDNPKLEGMLSKLPDITNKDDSVALAADSMTWVDEVISYFNYYTYPGSLTTSPCSEVVTWIVLKKKLGVSAAQVARFRSMLGEDGTTPLTEYRRHPQDLLGRSIQCATGCVKRE